MHMADALVAPAVALRVGNHYFLLASLNLVELRDCKLDENPLRLYVHC